MPYNWGNATDRSAWDNWWGNTTNNNSPISMGGGTLVKQGNVANWTNAAGETARIDQSMNPMEIAKNNPGLADELKTLLPGTFGGSNEGTEVSAPKTATNEPINLYEIFGQDLSKFKGPTTSSSSSSFSKSYSGMDPGLRKQLMSKLVPALTDSIENMDKNIDDYTQNAVRGSRRIANNVLQKDMPKYIEGLVAKGMLNADVGKEALRGAVSDSVGRAQDQAYGAGMNAAQMKYGKTGILGGVGNLGKYTSSSSGNSSGSSSSNDMAGLNLLLDAYSRFAA